MPHHLAVTSPQQPFPPSSPALIGLSPGRRCPDNWLSTRTTPLSLPVRPSRSGNFDNLWNLLPGAFVLPALEQTALLVRLSRGTAGGSAHGVGLRTGA